MIRICFGFRYSDFGFNLVPTQKNEKTDQKMQLLLRKEEEDSTRILSDKYHIPYTDLSLTPIEVDAIKLIPEDKARGAEMAAFEMLGKNVKVGVRNPQQEATQMILNGLKSEFYTTELYLVSDASLKHAWNYYARVPKSYEGSSGSIGVSTERLTELRKELTNPEEIRERLKISHLSRTTEVLELLLAGAIVMGASDIHVEPQVESVRVRFRIDGVLHDVADVAQELYHLVISRIKLVSEMKLNIHERAQDGRFTIHVAPDDIEVRTSILPGPNGENIVMRILDPGNIHIGFANLGMQPWVAEEMQKALRRPNGMILTTGPTGSGKTTTLYTFIQEIHTPEIKIITIEDPIEYHIQGVEQTQVAGEKGYDFANGLRTIVRQDPDVILVGEIRDLETAEIALQASLTGHLVFSTLHTNNAAGTIPRLLSIGVDTSILGPALNVSIAQRLVRELCAACKKPAELGEAEVKKIQGKIDEMPPNVPRPPKEQWQVYTAAEHGTCPNCTGIGYKGRIAVFEIILVNKNVHDLIMHGVTEYEMREEGRRQGQTTMEEDGLLKVLAGRTDVAELERIVGPIY